MVWTRCALSSSWSEPAREGVHGSEARSQDRDRHAGVAQDGQGGLTVWFTPALDATNSAPAGKWFIVPVSVQAQNSEQGTVPRSLRVDTVEQTIINAYKLH